MNRKNNDFREPFHTIMPQSNLLPVWDTSACVPREEILSGKLTDAELALSLSSVVWGKAKPPYDDPRTFFDATHTTRNMQNILEYIFGRLSKARQDVNPIIVLDVGFGGGKTHTLVALYYAAKFGNEANVREHLNGISVPDEVNVVAISGDEYGEKGLRRAGVPISTIWGDLFYQLKVYDHLKNLDIERAVPSLEDVKTALGDKPLLILLDELPTYLKLVGTEDPKMMDKTVQFIQRLVLAVAEKENAALVFAIAEDAYKDEAKLVINKTEESYKKAMEETRSHIRRKEIVMSPVEENDVVHILKRRLFNTINNSKAEEIADAYFKMYNEIAVPEELKKADFRDKIKENYPFHPSLIQVLYERVATLDRFQRTRGALRLLNRVVRRTWSEKEKDALLIHPFHVDLADNGIVDDLTEGIGEGKLRNAVEADIWKRGGGATAQELDEEVKSHWHAPLHRRACNVVYLYSLATGKEGDRGIDSELLVALVVTPDRPDHALRIRDSVFKKFSEDFHYIDRKGTHYLFIREPNPLRVIDREAKNITDQEATDVVRSTLADLFSDQPDWIHVEIFPTDPSKLADEPLIKLAILNPNLHHIIPESGDIPEHVSRFLTNSDVQGKKFRKFRNDTFFLVSEQSRLPSMWMTAKKLASAREVRKDLAKYGIPKDRKEDVEEYLSNQEKYINDFVRSAFCKFLHYDKKGETKIIGVNPNGYSGGRKGKAMFAYHLKDVFRRVIEDTLDPGYVETDAWPSGAPYISSQALLETFHGRPGLVIPTTQKHFKDTILRGIDENNWVIRHQDKVFTKDKKPNSISLDDVTEIWKFDEAQKHGLFKVEKDVGRLEYPEPKKTGKTTIRETKITGPMPFMHAFQDTPAETLADDLEKWTKRESIKHLDKIIIKIRGDPTTLFSIKNLLTRLGPETDCQPHLIITTERFSPPKFTISTDFTKSDMNESAAKTLLDAIGRLGTVDTFECNLTIDWPNVTIDKISQSLRNIAQSNKESLFSLEISGMKGNA